MDDNKPAVTHVEHIDDDKSSGIDPALPTLKVRDPTELKDGTTKEVFNAELYAALQETSIPRWSEESRHLYLGIFCALLCVVANGYDSSLMTAIIAMPTFQNVFHSGTTGSTVGVIFSLYQVGSAVLAPVGAIVSDRYGRRICMFSGSVIIILGMVVAATAKKVPQLVVGRFLLGSGVAFTQVGSAAYSMEVSPPHWRGRATGLYNCGWFAGSIPAAAVTFGCNYIGNNLAWQLPLILQALAALIICCLVWFIPESPRYFMANGREAEARAFLVKYHGNNDPNARLVHLEMEEMRQGIATDASDKRWWDYRPLFLTHSGRWRMLQVLLMSIAGQFSGNGLGYFNTVIYANLGVTSVAEQLGYNLISSVTSAVTGLLGAAFNDRTPRRKILVIGTLGCAVMLAINSGLSALLAKQVAQGDVSKSVAQGALAAYFLFGNCFTVTYTPLQAVIPAESLETTTRAKGLALSGIIVNAMGFINQFAGPIALGRMGYKYIYIFVAWDTVEALLWYLFGVESQGRTLEELEWIYEQPNPVKASLKLDKVVVADDGHVKAKVADA